jgi:hypothetical protein
MKSSRTPRSWSSRADGFRRPLLKIARFSAAFPESFERQLGDRVNKRLKSPRVVQSAPEPL